LAEAVMLHPGAAIGRRHAYDISFIDMLAADRRVTAHLNRKQIRGLLDPTSYTGLCADMARDRSKPARAVAKELLP
jgi:3-carboxy-cis,cis-muconate cycloisomerase